MIHLDRPEQTNNLTLMLVVAGGLMIGGGAGCKADIPSLGDLGPLPDGLRRDAGARDWRRGDSKHLDRLVRPTDARPDRPRPRDLRPTADRDPWPDRSPRHDLALRPDRRVLRDTRPHRDVRPWPDSRPRPDMRPICTYPRGDCNGLWSDGCETDLSRDASHCGRCRNLCSSGVCLAGTCGPKVVSATNPVLGGDRPDPHVTRDIAADGKPIFYLVHTVHNTGDIPIYSSRDLLTWKRESKTVFGRTRVTGSSLKVNSGHFCSIWAPQIVKLSGSYMLSFSAQRFKTAQTTCPAYGEDGGVYLASASTITGPYAPTIRSWEPLPAGAHGGTCPAATRNAIPRSVDYVSKNCQGGYCHQVIRLDSDVWRDPKDGRYWLSYSWFTNSPPLVAWEKTNQGEHVSITELDGSDPYTVKCDKSVAQVFAGNCQDKALLTKLASSCTGCGSMLSFTKGKLDQEMKRDSYSWGVVEGASLFRRGNYVYLLMSGSAWDSAYYHVFWVAAPTVAQLAYSNTSRLVGRYLVPSGGQSFGHGSPVLGPDGKSWFYVHHRLNHPACKAGTSCSRDVWVSPMEFYDRGDGKGQVHIKPRWPASTPKVSVTMP